MEKSIHLPLIVISKIWVTKKNVDNTAVLLAVRVYKKIEQIREPGAFNFILKVLSCLI